VVAVGELIAIVDLSNHWDTETPFSCCGSLLMVGTKQKGAAVANFSQSANFKTRSKAFHQPANSKNTF